MRKKKNKTFDFPMPYPHTVLELIPKAELEAWLKKHPVSAEEEAAIWQKWREGRAFMGLKEE